MQRDDYTSANQAPFAPGYSNEWNSIPSLPIPALQSNALAESAAWPHQDLATYMSSVHPSVMEKLDNATTTNRASSFPRIDANGDSPSFDAGDSTPQSIASALSSSSGWTKEQDKLLMSLKAQGLGYSAIQDERRKEFGWTRNKNVLVKRFAVLEKRCKPQIKTRIVRDISKRITLEIIKAVGKELEKVNSSGSNSIATELEDLVPLRLPEFLERLVADVGVSLHQLVEDDKRSST
ncbi:hypothetical protein FPHYL_2848 [Fusarium phyllophilum]|uniref:Myb-like domain-containing protein n=1 Tax=Fusarium phyllophilum TaxID=47803 RepID=A0A8H5KA07_9HYPO|nr:hypothetical protein FPHYL_2848 [Fusarium phyllophilum]